MLTKLHTAWIVPKTNWPLLELAKYRPLVMLRQMNELPLESLANEFCRHEWPFAEDKLTASKATIDGGYLSANALQKLLAFFRSLTSFQYMSKEYGQTVSLGVV